MITTELFVLLKLFAENDVSWWWVVAFVLSDGLMWLGLKEYMKK